MGKPFTRTLGQNLSWHNTLLPAVKEEILGADVVKFTGGESCLACKRSYTAFGRHRI